MKLPVKFEIFERDSKFDFAYIAMFNKPYI